MQGGCLLGQHLGLRQTATGLRPVELLSQVPGLAELHAEGREVGGALVQTIGCGDTGHHAGVIQPEQVFSRKVKFDYKYKEYREEYRIE